MHDLLPRALAAWRAGDAGAARELAGAAIAAGDLRGHGLLAAMAQSLGALDEALVHAEAALRAAPEDVHARARIGSIELARGRPDLAADHLHRAALRAPEDAALLNDYALALAGCRRAAEAEAVFRRASALRPDLPEIRNNLGNVLKAQQRFEDAAVAYREALALRQDYAAAHHNLGVVLQLSGDIDGAIASYDRALAASPDYAEAHTHRGAALAAQGKLTEAESAHREALRLQPKLVDAHNNLAIVLKDAGRLPEAVTAYRTALALDPTDSATHSNLLLCLNYDSEVDGPALFAAHRKWAAGHPPATPPAIARRPDRRLRVGYVSPDFREHSVASFIEPVFASHDPARVVAHAYSDVAEPDATTERLRSMVPRWRSTANLSDEKLMATIRADRIDVLIDLAGHTANNRLPLFARRAAPLQATWIGYPATTGLDSMDFRITDAVADPPGESESWHSERLLRLPGCFLCYRAPPDAPLPAERDRANTVFGSFNNLSKVGAPTVRLWSRVLTAVPGSLLLLKSRQLADARVRAALFDAFAACGIEAKRLLLYARTPARTAHLAFYQEMDVALDTVPYNGATTTCEALWMGVPVVTLGGRLHAGRVGTSLLRAAGRPEWATEDADTFVAAAVALAQARPNRSALRAAVAASALCDASAFVRALEAALFRVSRFRAAS